MNREILIFTALFIGLVLLQVLLFNHIAIFNVAFPIIFIYFIIRLPINLSLYSLFSLSFALGFIIDVFSDTLGVNALACTLLAAVKRPAYFAYVNKDDHTDKLIPSVTSLGVPAYAKYLFTMVIIYCILVFTIEYFSFADVKQLVILATSSCLITFLTLLAADFLIVPKS